LILQISTLASGIAEERFKAEVHMLLDVAVEKGEARLVGCEVDAGSAVVGDYYGVLDDAGGFAAVDLGEFELVAVEVHGVGVVGPVAEDETVTGALLKDEFLFVGVGFAVD
jgi:hypothetical protein